MTNWGRFQPTMTKVRWEMQSQHDSLWHFRFQQKAKTVSGRTCKGLDGTQNLRSGRCLSRTWTPSPSCLPPNSSSWAPPQPPSTACSLATLHNSSTLTSASHRKLTWSKAVQTWWATLTFGRTLATCWSRHIKHLKFKSSQKLSSIYLCGMKNSNENNLEEEKRNWQIRRHDNAVYLGEPGG